MDESADSIINFYLDQPLYFGDEQKASPQILKSDLGGPRKAKTFLKSGPKT